MKTSSFGRALLRAAWALRRTSFLFDEPRQTGRSATMRAGGLRPERSRAGIRPTEGRGSLISPQWVRRVQDGSPCGRPAGTHGRDLRPLDPAGSRRARAGSDEALDGEEQPQHALGAPRPRVRGLPGGSRHPGRGRAVAKASQRRAPRLSWRRRRTRICTRASSTRRRRPRAIAWSTCRSESSPSWRLRAHVVACPRRHSSTVAW